MNPTIDALMILPELIVTGLLVLIIVVDLTFPKTHRALMPLSIIGICVALISVMTVTKQGSLVGSSFVVDEYSLLAKGFFLAVTVLVLLMGLPQKWRAEYILMVLSALLGMLIVASARDMLLFFVAFELLAIPGYLLSGWQKRSQYGHEGVIKYYLLGVLSTSVMLYGISLIYGYSGGTSYSVISAALQEGDGGDAIVKIAMLFIVVGLAFKISAVPFHFWAPDAYQAAPIPVAAFLSVVTKAAGLIALMPLIFVAFDGIDYWQPMIWLLAALTMTVGNLAALKQVNIIRMLAYSSVAQAGYLLIPLAVADQAGKNVAIETIFDYLIIYAAMNIGAFAAVMAVVKFDRSHIDQFKGLFTRAPFVAIALTMFLLSLAGIPPLGGWFAKLVVFKSGIEAGGPGAIALVLLGAINSVVSLVYYGRVVRIMWAKAEPDKMMWAKAEPDKSHVKTDVEASNPLALNLLIVIAVNAFLVVLTGVLPGMVTYLGGLSSLAQ